MLAKSCLSIDIDLTQMLRSRQHDKRFSLVGQNKIIFTLVIKFSHWWENKLPSEGNIHGNPMCLNTCVGGPGSSLLLLVVWDFPQAGNISWKHLHKREKKTEQTKQTTTTQKHKTNKRQTNMFGAWLSLQYAVVVLLQVLAVIKVPPQKS